MKIWYKFLFLPVLILALAGCSKDDDDIVVNNDDNETPYVPYHSLDMTTDDGKVTQLLKHKVGKGIPIVILGDGFVDKDIKEGRFRDATTSTIDALFSIHPLKSLRDYFDVYEVTAVSYNYGYNSMVIQEDSTYNYETAFSTVGIEEHDPYVFTSKYKAGDKSKIYKYALKAIDENRIDDATFIMLINDFGAREFTTWFTYHSQDMDIPTGCSAAYVALEDIIKFSEESSLKDIFTSNYDDISHTSFAHILLHEFGHAFAKLADEYVEEERKWNDFENDKYGLTLEQRTGYDRNVSLESDVTKSPWADFAADSRYDFEKLGCYEGGYYQEKGVYRPTENSLMRHSAMTLYFNVISRAMFYKRCMNIAFGDSWKFNYEDFVKFDLEKAKAAYQEDKERYPYGYSKSKRLGAPSRFVKMKISR